jgi:two-component system, OmpR family, alkaline phosphatase synthesis response regulator PhoP
MTTVLVIEDDGQIRRVVEGYLRQAGYQVLTAADGVAGLALAQQAKPTLLVLDLMLPGLDGLQIARRLRAHPDPIVAGVYIIMLTARVEETERVIGLELGADDYITKPFSPREFVARVRAALRRLESQTTTSEGRVLDAGMLQLDPTYRTVTLDGKGVKLTTTEFDLLHYFMRHPGRPFSRADLLDLTQPDAAGDLSAYERTIDVHVKNLRHKLGVGGRRSQFIETVQGVGYRFSPAAARSEGAAPPTEG